MVTCPQHRDELAMCRGDEGALIFALCSFQIQENGSLLQPTHQQVSH